MVEEVEALEEDVLARDALERIANGNTSGSPGINELPQETMWREIAACRQSARDALKAMGEQTAD